LHPRSRSLSCRFWLTTGQHTKEWGRASQASRVAPISRRSARPLLLGFWQVQLGNVYYTSDEAHNPEKIERYARDIRRGWWDCTVQVSPGSASGWHDELCLVLGLGWGLSRPDFTAVM